MHAYDLLLLFKAGDCFRFNALTINTSQITILNRKIEVKLESEVEAGGSDIGIGSTSGIVHWNLTSDVGTSEGISELEQRTSNSDRKRYSYGIIYR